MLRIDRCLVDAGYMPTVVYDACRRVGGAMMPAKGVGIGASHKPMAEYRRKKGEVCGHHWHIPNVRPASELRHVRVDNEWKSRPGAPDNHWLDCLVGCAVAASTLGVSRRRSGPPRGY